jgi:hypothetical protein
MITILVYMQGTDLHNRLELVVRLGMRNKLSNGASNESEDRSPKSKQANVRDGETDPGAAQSRG